MVTTTLDGTPTFLSPPTPVGTRCSLVDRKSREELQVCGQLSLFPCSFVSVYLFPPEYPL